MSAVRNGQSSVDANPPDGSCWWNECSDFIAGRQMQALPDKHLFLQLVSICLSPFHLLASRHSLTHCCVCGCVWLTLFTQFLLFNCTWQT